MKPTTLAKADRILRPALTKLPPHMVVHFYSKGRLHFLKKLKDKIPEESFTPLKNLEKSLWGLKFRTPIMNAAGMFKNGECYEMVSRQGAGAYLGGTGTWNPREGNEKEGIHLPFVPYPKSHAASNWLGLPNDGDKINSLNAKEITEVAKIPVGWSIMGSPDYKEKLFYLVEGMKLYEKAGVDFIEINESCPNTGEGKAQDNGLANRLKYIQRYFLDMRGKRFPVIVKFSNDTEIGQLPKLLDLLFEFGYDGVNFGNTSTNYSNIRERINPKERKLYDFFTKEFGGGVSGKPLKEASLELTSRAVEYLKKGRPPQEFHVIRTGGIENKKDIEYSERGGISLNQWFTGYFENFAMHGHNLYRELFSQQTIKTKLS